MPCAKGLEELAREIKAKEIFPDRGLMLQPVRLVYRMAFRAAADLLMRFIPANLNSTLREQWILTPCDGRLSPAFDHGFMLCEGRVKLCDSFLDI